MCVSHPLPLSQESHFDTNIEGAINELWQQRNQGQFITKDGVKLAWCSMTRPEHDKAIVLVNGRVESFWKYQELIYDLVNQGYDVYSYDHRGQGSSQRLTQNFDIGFVEKFDDYIDDLAALIELFDLKGYQYRYLLGHSMGGAIVTRYLQTHPTSSFCAAALTAPMMGIEMPKYLAPIALPLTRLMSWLVKTPHYAPGHKPYYPKPFADNRLTQSKVRYHWFRQLYDTMPQLRLGGPSTHWVWQSLKAIKAIHAQTDKIAVPLLVLQAGEEQIVANTAQDEFMHKLATTRKDCAFEVINGARHELLFEQDQYRQPTLNSILAFFSSARGTGKEELIE
ncbi:alpha/beta fold hydrolase [Vibrio sp. WXL210]|uniref:alpha/beta fold hydrolase n=1 Tax=Vibrio sp. WXL210 TaxID=3450709 RepID=UPI003EC7A8A1